MNDYDYIDNGQFVYTDFEQFIYAVIKDMDYRMSCIEKHLDIEPERNITIKGDIL